MKHYLLSNERIEHFANYRHFITPFHVASFTIFIQFFSQPFFSLFLLDKNNRKRKEEEYYPISRAGADPDISY
jgi:hypothetical protein